jgi:DNA-binding protein HU-beta
MAKKAKAGQDSVTLKDIASEMDGEFISSANGRMAFLKAFLEAVTGKLSDGVKVKIPDFGILQVKDRPARKGRNPATGETINIKASKKVGFRVAKSLKEAVL